MSLAVDVAGTQLTLLPEKAVWLAAEKLLLVADAHFGKAVSFRRQGVAVPRGTTSGTLERLSALVARHAPRRVVFLGDFLHSRDAHAASTLGALARWRAAHSSLDLTLVRGNHDDRAGDPPPALEIEAVDEPWRHGALALCHHPAPVAGAYTLAGHLHPCTSVAGRAHDRLRLPCFWFGPAVGVLPAFGDFTGMFPVRCADTDAVYAVAGDRVVALAPRPSGVEARRLQGAEG